MGANPASVLTRDDLALLDDARRGVLATIARDGRPRLVPVCFVAGPGAGASAAIYLPLDEKPKRPADVRQLARVRDILERPRAALLVDRWDEDWSRLAWLRLEGTVALVEPGRDTAAEHAGAVAALRERYPQYATQRLEANPLMRLRVERVVRWAAASAAATTRPART